MVAHRRLPFGTFLTFALVAATGCVPFNEPITGRDVTCQDTPEPLCQQIIDFTFATHPEEVNDVNEGPITEILVSPMDCRFVADQTATRCWEVEMINDGDGVSAQVYQRADGNLAQ